MLGRELGVGRRKVLEGNDFEDRKDRMKREIGILTIIIAEQSPRGLVQEYPHR